MSANVKTRRFALGLNLTGAACQEASVKGRWIGSGVATAADAAMCIASPDEGARSMKALWPSPQEPGSSVDPSDGQGLKIVAAPGMCGSFGHAPTVGFVVHGTCSLARMPSSNSLLCYHQPHLQKGPRLLVDLELLPELCPATQSSPLLPQAPQVLPHACPSCREHDAIQLIEYRESALYHHSR